MLNLVYTQIKISQIMYNLYFRYCWYGKKLNYNAFTTVITPNAMIILMNLNYDLSTLVILGNWWVEFICCSCQFCWRQVSCILKQEFKLSMICEKLVNNVNLLLKLIYFIIPDNDNMTFDILITTKNVFVN